jgi:hypothetical protein
MKTQVHFDVHAAGADVEKNEKHFMPLLIIKPTRSTNFSNLFLE